jgi:hypothetical protein
MTRFEVHLQQPEVKSCKDFTVAKVTAIFGLGSKGFQKILKQAVLWIRIAFNANPDPGL